MLSADELRAAEALRVLRSLVRYEVGNAHSHSVPCVWDSDNRPGVRGESCPRCHAFLAARLLLGLGAAKLPEGPSVETLETLAAMREARSD